MSDVMSSTDKQSKNSSPPFLFHDIFLKVLWPQKDSLPLSLKGGPVYIQVCLLGQLSQTELFPPVFPQLVNNTLAFDRVIMIINWTHDLLLFLGVQSPFVAARSLERFEKLF